MTLPHSLGTRNFDNLMSESPLESFSKISSSPRPPANDLRDSEKASLQLLLELSRSAEAAMVSTRSHGHALQTIDTNSQRREYDLGSSSKKRKLAQEADDTPSKSRKQAKHEEKAIAVVIEQPHQSSTKKALPERLRTSAVESREKLDEVAGTTELDMRAEDENIGHKIRGSPQQENTGFHDSIRNSNLPLVSMAGNDDSLKQPSPDLKRFAGEELEALIQEGRANAEDLGVTGSRNEGEVVDSDDEAPEEAATAAGNDRIGAAAAKAAETAMKEQAAQKAKRREHDERMRTQAKGAKKTNSKRIAIVDDGASDDVAEDKSSVPEREKDEKTPLPAFLPEEILTAQPAIRPPTPSKPPIKPQINTKQNLLLDRQDKLPRDLVRGNTKIRILQSQQTMLPPKASAKGRDIREKWLLGQRGDRPGLWVPRQKPSCGFIRKAG